MTLFCLILYALGQTATFSSINVGMMVFWHVWWPFIPFLILFFGNFWCSICPYSAIAVALNRLLPYRLCAWEWLERNGLVVSLLTYLAVIGLDAIFGLEQNPLFSLMFIGSMFALMITMVILFGYKAFCLAGCPVGLFVRVYRRFSFFRLTGKEEVCGKCRRTSWEQAKPLFGGKNTEETAKKKDWRHRVECLKRCKSHSVQLTLQKPCSDDGHRTTTLLEDFAPAIVLMALFISVMLKSSYSIQLFDLASKLIPLSFSTVILGMILAGCLFFAVVHIGLYRLSARFVPWGQPLFLLQLRSLVPLLISFHIALVLDEIQGISPLGQVISSLSFLQTSMPTAGTLLYASYGIMIIGSIGTFVSSYVMMRTERRLGSLYTFNLPATLLVFLVAGGYSFVCFAIFQIMQTIAC
ncbi:MAG: 4Fe-4S binding protein [Pseudomonadota bacterium]